MVHYTQSFMRKIRHIFGTTVWVGNHYTGSLTTPPCSEGVHWVLMQDVVQLSARQIAAFTAAYDGTDRPIQPVGNREVAVDVSGN